MQKYDIFYRKHGVRRLADITSPKVFGPHEMELPIETVVHYLPYIDGIIGPAKDDFLFRHYEARILIEHVQTLVPTDLTYRHTPGVIATTLTNTYMRAHRSIRPLHDYDKSCKDPRSLIIQNYAQLSGLYYYQKNVYSNIYKWTNILRTLFSNINSLISKNERQHYLTIQVPKHIPELITFKRNLEVQEKIVRKDIPIFNDPINLLLLEFYKYLSNKEVDSLFRKIDSAHIHKFNLIFVESGYWSLINVGTLLDIFKLESDEADGSLLIQTKLLNFISILSESRNSTNIETSDEEDTYTSPEEEDVEVVDEEAKEELGIEDIPVEVEDIYIEEGTTPRETNLNKIEAKFKNGEISKQQKNKLITLLSKVDTIVSPFDNSVSLNDYRVIEKKDLEVSHKENEIPKLSMVADPSMFKATMKTYDKQYITKILNKDIVNMSMAIEKAGVLVTDYKVEEIQTASDHYRKIKMQIQPIDGNVSTVSFKIPVINEDGTYISNNNVSRLRKQRSDMPIRKISPFRVALTSYYSKVFVLRSQKMVVNYPKWLSKQILIMAMDSENEVVTEVSHADVFVNDVKLPRIYTTLSMDYISFVANKKYKFIFDYKTQTNIFGGAILDKLVKDKYTAVGYLVSDKNTIIAVNEDNVFYILDKNGTYSSIGTIEDILGIDKTKAPIEIAEFEIYKKNISVGILLTYWFGLSRLIKLLGVSYRTVAPGSRLNLEDNEYPVKLSDTTYIFNTDNKVATLILAGINRYHRSIGKFTSKSMDNREALATILEQNGITTSFLKDIQLTFEMFVDPITESILTDLKEPTSLDLLIIRAVELLLTDWHPLETDLNYMRIRGYERLAGLVYTELAKGVRAYRKSRLGSNNKIDINPEAVWIAFNSDSSNLKVEQLNPMVEMKEVELVSFLGSGGRTGRSMVKRTRAYHESDIGVISEATPDGANVGVNTYLSGDPNFDNLRGISKKNNTTSPTNIMSSGMLLAPTADRDDTSRVNMISIHNGHIFASKGYKVMPLRTGYEKVIPHRVSSLYSVVAREDGLVKDIKENGAIFEFKDGTTDIVEIGKIYGKVSNKLIPHEVVCDLKVGAKFSKGDVIAYNTYFFSRDMLDSKQVILKQGVLAKTALMEVSNTLEDASVISEKLANDLTSPIVVTKSVNFKFDKAISNVLKVGDVVNIETILCIIEENVVVENSLFDEESIDKLKRLASNTPTAKIKGTIERIEVYYNGDIKDMSPSIAKLVKHYDKEREIKLLEAGKKVTTGKVNSYVNIGGRKLNEDTVTIQFFIAKEAYAGVGDKGVFCNQLKTIFSHIMTGRNETENGEPLDALFSYQSVSNRIVLSPEIMGTTNTLLKHMSKRVADLYFQKKGK